MSSIGGLFGSTNEFAIHGGATNDSGTQPTSPLQTLLPGGTNNPSAGQPAFPPGSGAFGGSIPAPGGAALTSPLQTILPGTPIFTGSGEPAGVNPWFGGAQSGGAGPAPGPLAPAYQPAPGQSYGAGVMPAINYFPGGFQLAPGSVDDHTAPFHDDHWVYRDDCYYAWVETRRMPGFDGSMYDEYHQTPTTFTLVRGESPDQVMSQILACGYPKAEAPEDTGGPLYRPGH